MFEIAPLIHQLAELQTEFIRTEEEFREQLDPMDGSRQASARNLLHYMALRRHDIRGLQDELAHLGMSSLGRCESHVLSHLHRVLELLQRLSDRPVCVRRIDLPIADLVSGRDVLAQRTVALFGPEPEGRAVRIMVTMPTEAASDYGLVRDLLRRGMNCLRINCAHDDAPVWEQMIRNLRRGEAEVGGNCRVLMDVAGPKLRTAAIAPGPEVIKWRPRRDRLGRVTAPARIWLTPVENPEASPPGSDAQMPVDALWLAQTKPGDEVRFRDARGRLRRLHIVAAERRGRWAETDRTAYLTSGATLKYFENTAGGMLSTGESVGRVGQLPPTEQPISLKHGDTLILTDDRTLGDSAERDPQGNCVRPAHIGCTLPEVLRQVTVGERILFDDGKIAGIIREVSGDHLAIEITRPDGDVAKLQADKGINFPDSKLVLDALTEKDIRDLEFIVQHADMVGYSFVRRAADVRRLQDELSRLGGEHLGIILKIENREAFEHLPRLLLQSLRSRLAGVMIVRGDLAVECGYERLAELQEEILWMCEAAHLPVVWATQVLENLAKTGIPSRAEITDAAMGVRAECVMLNKGPHIVEAVEALDNILRRMQDHQLKKRTLLRKLHVADDLRLQDE